MKMPNLDKSWLPLILMAVLVLIQLVRAILRGE